MPLKDPSVPICGQTGGLSSLLSGRRGREESWHAWEVSTHCNNCTIRLRGEDLRLASGHILCQCGMESDRTTSTLSYSFTHVNLKQAISVSLCMIFHIFPCIAVLGFNKGLTATPICAGCECRLSSPSLVGRPPTP